jgi:repressor LexA
MLYETIKALAKAKGLSINALERELGFSRGSLNKIDMHTPSIERLKRIASYLEVPIYALDGSLRETPQPTTDHSHWIPVLGRVAAGEPLEMIEDILDYEEVDDKLGETFALQINGDSMSPRFLKGDIVIVRRQEDVENGEIAIVCVNGEDATCKKVMKHEGGISLVSLNPSYAPMYFTNEEVKNIPVTILGRVVELRGKI